VALSAKIRWVADPELSAAHSAYVVATGAACTDSKTEQLLIGPVTEINNRLLSSSIDVAVFWQQYLARLLLGAQINAACAAALMSGGCSELQVEQTSKAISNRLSDARQAYASRFPKLGEQLELRARPLREKWDAVGPGLLRDVERQVWDNSPPSGWWTPRLTAQLVQPIRGGDGGYAANAGKFWIEAMLTDVDPRVPEVLRVAWLITRIAIESHTRNKPGEQSLATAWSLACVPLVLTAAVNLDLIPQNPLPIKRAMELWQRSDANIGEELEQWWTGYKQSPAPLPVALRQLDQSLAAARLELGTDLPTPDEEIL
jgi:hypothetical protein